MLKFVHLIILFITTRFEFIESQTVEDFVKIRCDTTGKSTYFTWSGTIFNYMPQKKPELIFKFIGFNVARCTKSQDGSWQLLTRELSYYLDPETDEKLNFWQNPYTGEKLNVIHVSNDPVNSKLSAVRIEKVSDSTGAIISDFPLFYPNPLYGNETFSEYGGLDRFYEAGEFFKFYFNFNELQNSKENVENVTIAWNRIGPYVPWMKMGNIKGQLVYSTFGKKDVNLDNLPKWLRDDVYIRLPLYIEAPITNEKPNETAFTYFKKYFDEYIRGEQFPLPAYPKIIKNLEFLAR